jgi:hypothetical protein
MDFKVGSKVFYPSHGAGWIKDQKEIEFSGQKKMYYEFEFINSPISISTPLDNVNNLNIREVEPPEKIKEKISVLKKTPSKDPKTKDFNKLIEIFKKLADQATELNRAIGDIVGELAVSSGTKFETAAKTFEKVTGIKADVTQSKYYNR